MYIWTYVVITIKGSMQRICKFVYYSVVQWCMQYLVSVLPKIFTAPVRSSILRRFRQVTHTIPIWWQSFTRPKHDFTCRGRVDGWLGRSLLVTPQLSGLEGYCRHGLGGQAAGRAGGCQTCGTHISVTAWWIFSIRSSVELSRPVVVHRHGHLPICPIWACPWAKNLSNLAQIGSRLCGTHISETAG